MHRNKPNITHLLFRLQLIVEEVKKLMKNDPTVAEGTEMNSILVDHYLWDYRRDHSQETDTIPIHRVRCIYYWVVKMKVCVVVKLPSNL